MAYGPRTGEGESRGVFFVNEGNGPKLKGSFELTREDLSNLVKLAKEGPDTKIEFKLVMWDAKKSKAGKPYYGLQIDTYQAEKKKEADDIFGSNSAPDDEIPF